MSFIFNLNNNCMSTRTKTKNTNINFTIVLDKFLRMTESWSSYIDLFLVHILYLQCIFLKMCLLAPFRVNNFDLCIFVKFIKTACFVI